MRTSAATGGLLLQSYAVIHARPYAKSTHGRTTRSDDLDGIDDVRRCCLTPAVLGDLMGCNPTNRWRNGHSDGGLESERALMK